MFLAHHIMLRLGQWRGPTWAQVYFLICRYVRIFMMSQFVDFWSSLNQEFTLFHKAIWRLTFEDVISELKVCYRSQ